MAHLFTYIAHNNGVLADSAAELAVAATKMAGDAPVTAIVTGTGGALDTVCQAATDIYAKIWKVDHAALAHPNAEVVRKLLMNLLPPGCILLLAHDILGMDLGPGLSVKLNAVYTADVVGINAVADNKAMFVRQEYAGMVHTHVNGN